MDEQKFYTELGKTYRGLREEAGIIQETAALNAGIPQAALSNFERLGKKLSAYRLKLLFEQVGVDLFGKKKRKLFLNVTTSRPTKSNRTSSTVSGRS